jgi:hypothetical protein
MKKLLLTALIAVCLLIAGNNTYGQSSVDARDILDDIKHGKDVSYKNVTIQGDLDLTYFFEKKYEEKYKERKSWFGSNDNVVEEIIDSSIRFENCTFQDDVLAYFHDEYSEYTFVASFNDDVIFKNCNFKEKSAFKYSEFDAKTDFSESTFNEEANFKYAKFRQSADFGGAFFDDNANFKYAKFRNGLNFSYTTFDRDLNLKYAKIYGDFSSSKMKVKYDLDVKYAEVNGESFSKYLLSED